LAEANYTDGEKHGIWLIWDENGVLRYEMEYTLGIKSGIWKMYNEMGELVSQKDYSKTE